MSGSEILTGACCAVALAIVFWPKCRHVWREVSRERFAGGDVDRVAASPDTVRAMIHAMTPHTVILLACDKCGRTKKEDVR